MTLDEAIKYTIEKSQSKKCNKDCKAYHAQLANWLKELKKLKAEKPVKCYSWNDTHLKYDAILKSRKIGSGSFVTAFQYTDDNGIRHWKTGWYSNRSNYIDDFENGSFHEVH